MIDLALSVASSLAIGMIFKHAGRRGLDRMALLTANYAVAFVVAGALLALGREGPAAQAVSAGLSALSLATGTLFILTFFLLALATQVAGMSLATGVMRLSVVIPFLASWIIWGEVPTPAQGVGLCLAGGAFFLIARKENPAARTVPAPVEPEEAEPRSTGRAFAVLALLFFAGGAVDTFMKTFDEVFAAESSRPLFLLMVFGVAFLIGLGRVLWSGLRTGRWPQRETLRWGVLLGFTNYAAAVFFLRAIERLSGPFVFPANNIALVIGAALLGVYVWGEHLSRRNWLGLALAAVALLLLNL